MGANWKTTAAGTAAILAAASHILYGAASGDLSSAFSAGDFSLIFAGIVGLFAKDHNVTGGNVSQ